MRLEGTTIPVYSLTVGLAKMQTQIALTLLAVHRYSVILVGKIMPANPHFQGLEQTLLIPMHKDRLLVHLVPPTLIIQHKISLHSAALELLRRNKIVQNLSQQLHHFHFKLQMLHQTMLMLLSQRSVHLTQI